MNLILLLTEYFRNKVSMPVFPFIAIRSLNLLFIKEQNADQRWRSVLLNLNCGILITRSLYTFYESFCEVELFPIIPFSGNGCSLSHFSLYFSLNLA